MVGIGGTLSKVGSELVESVGKLLRLVMNSGLKGHDGRFIVWLGEVEHVGATKSLDFAISFMKKLKGSNFGCIGIMVFVPVVDGGCKTFDGCSF